MVTFQMLFTNDVPCVDVAIQPLKDWISVLYSASPLDHTLAHTVR
jgi:hypothetical protein